MVSIWSIVWHGKCWMPEEGKGLNRVTSYAARGGAVINRALAGPAEAGSLPSVHSADKPDECVSDHRTRSIGIAKEERNGKQ